MMRCAQAPALRERGLDLQRRTPASRTRRITGSFNPTNTNTGCRPQRMDRLLFQISRPFLPTAERLLTNSMLLARAPAQALAPLESIPPVRLRLLRDQLPTWAR